MDRVVEVLTKSSRAMPTLLPPKTKSLVPTATKPTKVEQLRAHGNLPRKTIMEEELAQATKLLTNTSHQEIRENVSLSL